MNNITSKILFVDDDQPTRTALRRVLQDESWECQFVSSGNEALTLLAKTTFDLVVSDVKMPEMDGIELLAEIKRRNPGTVRLFLTAFPGLQEVSQALAEGSAQQIIPKPWSNQELKEIIRTALRQSSLQKKHSPEFQQRINSIPLLPPLPENYTQIQACISDDDIDIERMASLISQDVAISTALLHWANSALFGQRYRVDSIKKAIIVLGTEIVENLILSDSINQAIASNIPKINGFNLGKFKVHSMATAIISRLLIKSLYVSDSEIQDRAFIAGLLHDMGKLAEASFFSAQFAAAIQLAREKNGPLAAAETEILGTDHAELGSFLAEWWALPPFIVSAIQCHHSPESSPIEQDVINAVYVANLLSHQFGYGIIQEAGEVEIKSPFWDKFYLSEEALEIMQIDTETTIQVLSNNS